MLAAPPRKMEEPRGQKARRRTRFADPDFYTGDPAKFGRA